MNLPLFFSKRYFASKRSLQVINLITYISALGVMAGTMALVVVLSVFNGFEHLIVSLYGTFDADLRVGPLNGAIIQADSAALSRIASLPGIKSCTPVCQGTVLLKYRDKQYFATLKGINTTYYHQLPLSQNPLAGEAKLQNKQHITAAMGQTVAGNLGIRLLDPFNPLFVYAANPDADPASIDQSSAFLVHPMLAGSVFTVQQDIDSRYVLVPLHFARQVLQTNADRCNAIEILLTPEADESTLRASLKQILGNQLNIQNKYEQHELLYQIMQTEKWAVFFILLFILIVASFNVIGSLTMLLVEKQKDLAVLKSMGAGTTLLKKIFLTHGMLITLWGAVPGLLLGACICWVQQTYGIIQLGQSGSFIVDAYPVRMEIQDFALSLGAVLLVGLSASLYAVRGFGNMEAGRLSAALKSE